MLRSDRRERAATKSGFKGNIQLLGERLSEKGHATIPKGIVSGF